MAFYLERIFEYKLKIYSFSLELFSFVKQLAGLNEEHLDLGLTVLRTTDRQVLKSAYLHKSLPKIPTLAAIKKFVLTPSNCVETFRR